MFGDSGLIAEHFGRNVQRLRRRVDLSQERLARRAELHRTEIGLLERGTRLPRLDTIVKVAGGLEIEAGALFEGLEWIPGSNNSGAFSVPPRPKAPQRRGRAD
jgi:transcriptional regulator with XRE-family HTH domain